MSREKQIEGYLTTKLKPKNKIECVAWLLLNVFGCKFCKACRDKPCNIKDGETCIENIANYIREVVKEEAGYRKQSEWISVEERLPKVDTDVLVITANGSFKVGRCNIYHNGTLVLWMTNDGLGEKAITHWMPLPEAPKMKGEVVKKVKCKKCGYRALTSIDGEFYCLKENKSVRCKDCCGCGKPKLKGGVE